MNTSFGVDLKKDDDSYSYPAFIKAGIELVRGCKNTLCNTRVNCSAYGVKQKIMEPFMAQTAIDCLENDSDIRHILLFGAGDSSNYPYASKLKFSTNTRCSVSIVYPFLDEFPDHLNRMYRVNSLTDIATLFNRIRHPNVVHFIASKETLNSCIEMVQQLRKLREIVDFRLTIKSYNYYDRVGENYVDYDSVCKLLNSAGIRFERVHVHYTSNTEIFVNYDGLNSTIFDYKVTSMKDLILKKYTINENSPLPLSQWGLNIH